MFSPFWGLRPANLVALFGRLQDALPTSEVTSPESVESKAGQYLQEKCGVYTTNGEDMNLMDRQTWWF